VSVFYLLPPRAFLGKRFAVYLQGLFPGLTWTSEQWSNLAEGLTAAATCHPGVYVVHREELPEEGNPARSLVDGFGAEPGDEVIELRVSQRVGELAVQCWRIPQDQSTVAA
jgi:hypothetical protein